MTDKEKEMIRMLNHPVYTVEFLESWINRNDTVFTNSAAALQDIEAKGFYSAVQRMAQARRSTGKRDISGQEVFEGDVIENQYGLKLLIKYGIYQAYCPVDKCYMDNVGFYAEAPDYPEFPQMPIGPLEDYAKVVFDEKQTSEIENKMYVEDCDSCRHLYMLGSLHRCKSLETCGECRYEEDES